MLPLGRKLNQHTPLAWAASAKWFLCVAVSALGQTHAAVMDKLHRACGSKMPSPTLPAWEWQETQIRYKNTHHSMFLEG